MVVEEDIEEGGHPDKSAERDRVKQAKPPAVAGLERDQVITKRPRRRLTGSIACHEPDQRECRQNGNQAEGENGRPAPGEREPRRKNVAAAAPLLPAPAIPSASP